MSRSPTVDESNAAEDGDSVLPQSSADSDTPMRIQTLMRAKYDIIKEELVAKPQSVASIELGNRRGLIQEEIDELLGRSSVHARMNLTTFTPWKYDIREHFAWTRPGSASQFERFQNSIGITKLDRGMGSQLKLVFVNCPTSEPTGSDLLRLLSSPLLDGFIDTDSIDTAGQYGRIALVDFRSTVWETNTTTPSVFIRGTIVGLLCSIFNETIVDGIPFTVHEPGKYREFKEWFNRVSTISITAMIAEFRRLTRIAFRVHRSSPVVLIIAGIDRIPDDTFVSLIKDDLDTTERPIILVCEGSHTRAVLDQLRDTVPRASSSSIMITNNESTSPRKRKRKISRKIKPHENHPPT